MKATNFLRIKPLQGFTVAVLAALALASCSKSDSGSDYPVNQFAQVEIIHAAAGAPALDVSFDNNRLGVTTFNFTDRIDYLRATPGNRNFKVFSAWAASSTPLFTKDLAFEAGKHYSVFIVDTASKMDVVLLRDSSRAAGTDSVRLRFANMSPDAPALDLYVKDNPTPIATNITYKTAGNFFSYKSGVNVVFQIRATGQSTLLATSDPVNLVNSRIYTVWNGGYINGNETAGTRIRISSFTHNPLYY
ncbi:DUF4397 domain-containing protein [Niabella aquatica]